MAFGHHPSAPGGWRRGCLRFGDAAGEDDLSPSAAPTSTTEPPLIVRLPLALLACGSVIPLLAWVSDLGAFHRWALFVGVPSVVAVVVFALGVARPRWPQTFDAMVAGALGGLLGALAYDLFRLPFVYGLGRQLLAPIDSYGVLLLDAETSSPLSGFVGWAYHFTNGIGFGVAYGLVARNRHIGWALLWAMVLETATVVTGFGPTYGLVTDAGLNVVPIAIAYAAHVPYGLAVGWAVRDAERIARQAREVTRRPVLVAVAAVLVSLALWHRPLVPDDAIDRGRSVADGPSAIVEGRRLEPAWLRVADGECAVVRNVDDRTVTLGANGEVVAEIEPGERSEVCGGAERAIDRLQVDGRPFSGGWLIVDPDS